MLDAYSTTRNWFRSLVAGFVLWTLAPMSASAQDAPFAWLIEDGLAALQNRSFADDRGIVYNGARDRAVFRIVNGQKTSEQVATADMAAWTVTFRMLTSRPFALSQA